MARAAILQAVAARIPQRVNDSAVRVAVDGVDGAGKSVFADELADSLRAAGRPIVRASVDDFHRPRDERYRRGRDSPSGFWLDSFDYPRLHQDLLDPLRPGGSRRYRAAAHDLVTDQYRDEPWQVAAPGTVLILDGLFLHRDELHGLWDLSVDLHVAFPVTAARMAARDGTHLDPEHPSMRRADLVIDNNDWQEPVVLSVH